MRRKLLPLPPEKRFELLVLGRKRVLRGDLGGGGVVWAGLETGRLERRVRPRAGLKRDRPLPEPLLLSWSICLRTFLLVLIAEDLLLLLLDDALE